MIASLVPGAEIRRPTDLTHVLWRDPNSATPAAYRRLLREPVDADVLTEVAHWLAQRLK